MKSKLCWIPFIPVTIAVIVLKVCETLNVFPLLPTNTLSYISIGLVLLMFAVNIVFTIADKKTSPAYLLTRNLFAAVCAMLAAVCVASRSALTIILALPGSFSGKKLPAENGCVYARNARLGGRNARQRVSQ